MFVEWCFRGNAARSSHAFKKNDVKQQADNAHAEEADTGIRLFCVWASRREESPCSSLVRHRAAWNHQRTPFQQRLGAQMGTVFAACVADFFQHGAKSCKFSGLAFGCVFHARFWARLIDVCSQSTHFWAQNTDSK